jgi:regulatory protein
MTDLSMQLREGEGERAWHVWEKKFGTPADSAIESAKQQRFLQQRGFSHASIQMVMRRARKGEES